MLPTGLGATELIEFINAVLPQDAEAVKPQPEKKTRKKKDEAPIPEAIEGKLLEEAIATPLIPLPDSELAKLRPDLLTLEDQDIRSALAEQEANRLTVVSVPAPPDSDELEDLV